MSAATVALSVETPDGAVPTPVLLDDAPRLRLVTDRLFRAPKICAYTLDANLGRWTLRERFADRDAAQQRLDELRALPDNLSPLPFTARGVAADSEPGSPIGKAVAGLERGRFRLDRDSIATLESLGLWNRAWLLAPSRRDGTLRYVHVGRDLAARLGKREITAAIGERYDAAFTGDGGDRYWRLSSDHYNAAFADGEPRRDHVDAIIPDKDGGTPARLQYDRLVVRVALLSGDPGLLITTDARPMLLPLAPTAAPPPRAARAGSSKSS